MPLPVSCPSPEILKATRVAESRFFHVEALDLRFSNGVERRYERLPPRGRQAVIVVAVTGDDEVVLVKEYLAGLHKYELGLAEGHGQPSGGVLRGSRRP